MNLKPKYVESKTPNPDEWSEIYDAAKALIERLGMLTWADRDVAYKEYCDLIDALNARGTKPFNPL